jgi:hypothetical protein
MFKSCEFQTFFEFYIIFTPFGSSLTEKVFEFEFHIVVPTRG